MATLYTNMSGQQNAPTTLGMLDTTVATPTTRVLQPVYTLTAAEAASDVIYLCKVPAGTTVLPYLCNVYSDGVATTATITVGDAPVSTKDTTAASASRYSTALDVAASGVDAFTGGAAATVPYQTVNSRWITATLATLGTPVAGKKLQFNIAVNQVS